MNSYELDLMRINFIQTYVVHSLHAGVPLIDLVKEAKKAWVELIKA